MAKYDITYSCGHSGTVQLFGPHRDRDRKIEWYQDQADCPECYKAKMRAKQALEPITMRVTTNGLDKDANGNIMAEISLQGGTLSRKDEIKGMGYRWRELRGGVMDMLSAESAPQAWCKQLPIIKIGQSSEWDEIAKEAEVLGAQIEIKIDIISMELAVKHTSAKQTADAKIAELPKPLRPEYHPRCKGRWNGKIYGKKGGYNYYVDNVKHSISDEECENINKYEAEWNNYKSLVAKIKKEAGL